MLGMEKGLSLAELQRLQRKKYQREVRKADLDETIELRMTSLMDIFVNVLIYLLMNYSSSPIDTAQTEKRRLPKSTTKYMVRPHTTIGVTTIALLVNRKFVCSIRDGIVDASYKKDGQATSYLILPVLEKLKDAVNDRKRKVRNHQVTKFKGIVIILADHRMPFRLLSEIMYTAGQAEFG